ncbi:hypothetical protein [Lactobacillus delbrueckii]|uniref:hypothetical protein n=1 Tax=Lactobacillus delbrueckii TaxID=1584 RepID=UPI001E469B5B|nr:hypothetical protein [Lactobacillus delbrueckii]MCD5445405.1 hypothetical protein [Lactobacillus delbrueckii subsp. lactis]
MNYKVTVNNVEIGEFESAELLWQALSEYSDNEGINFELNLPTDDDVAEWGYAPDNSIKALLAWSKSKGYIEDYEMEAK